MLIKRLNLKNWRAFPGENLIEFSTDPKKPITIVHAENEFGKTSLLSAIRWCLHETVPPNVDDKLIDSNTKGPAEVELLIESDFEGKKYDYKVSRKIEKSGVTNLTVLIDRGNGFDTPTMSDKDIISNLLPEELCDIFLFSGENLSKAFQDKDGNKVRDSILKVTGISNADITLEYLKEFVTLKEKNKDKLEKDALKSKNVKKELTDNENKRDALIKKRDLAKEQVKELENDIDEAHKELSKFSKNKEDLEKAASDLGKFKNNKEQTEAEIKKLKSKRKDLLSIGMQVFIFDLHEKLPNPKDKKEKKPLPYTIPMVPARNTDKLLDKIKEVDECICGRKVNHDEDCIASIERHYTGGKDLGILHTRHTDAKNKMELLKVDAGSFLNDKSETEADIKTKEKTIKDLDDLIKGAEEVLASTDDKRIQELNKEIKIKDDTKTKLKEEIEGTENTWGYDHFISKYVTEIKKLKSQNIDDVSPQVKLLSKEINFLKKQIQFLEFEQKKAETKTKKSLESALNEFCQKYSRTGTRFEFKNGYIPQFLTGNQTEEDQASTGKEGFKSVFFGAALIKIAEERKDEKDPIIDPGCSGTWVCDAPFAGMDRSNLTSSAKVILDYGEQLIVFVNAQQYDVAFQEALKKNKKLGKRWLIQRNITGKPGSEISTQIKIDNISYETILKSKKGYDFSSFLEIN